MDKPKGVAISNKIHATGIPHNAILLSLVFDAYHAGADNSAVVSIEYSLNCFEMSAKVMWCSDNDKLANISNQEGVEVIRLSQLRHRLFVDYSGLLVEKGRWSK